MVLSRSKEIEVHHMCDVVVLRPITGHTGVDNDPTASQVRDSSLAAVFHTDLYTFSHLFSGLFTFR